MRLGEEAIPTKRIPSLEGSLPTACFARTSAGPYNSGVRRGLLVCTTFCFVLAAAPCAFADAASEAGQDFATGQRAFAAGDYRAAGTAFEEAYKKKPHHASLWNAGRSWQHAGELPRAANLYLRYLGEAPMDARDRDHATEALRDLSTRLARLDVKSSEARELRVDGQE